MKKAKYIKPSVMVNVPVRTDVIAASTYVKPGETETPIPVEPGTPQTPIDSKKNNFNLWEDDEE